jgi:hypothetical protein
LNTDELAEKLAREVEPAPALPRPGARARAWFLGAVVYVAVLAVAMIVVPASERGTGSPFWFAQAAAIAASLFAAVAAFASVVPGLVSRAQIGAAAAVLIWLASLIVAPGQFDWSTAAAASHEWLCVGFIVLGGAPLLAALAWLLRAGAPLRPATTAAFAALSVATLANVGACAALPHENGAIMLLWHGGVVVSCVALAALAGRFLFSWRTVRSLSKS